MTLSFLQIFRKCQRSICWTSIYMVTSGLYQQFNFQANISPYFNVFKYIGAIIYRRFVKKIFLKISQNSLESTCIRTSFLIKLQIKKLQMTLGLKWVKLWSKLLNVHRVRSVHVWSFSGLYFSAFGLNTERYGVSLGIQPKCAKMRIRKTPNMDTFHAVVFVKETDSRRCSVK